MRLTMMTMTSKNHHRRKKELRKLLKGGLGQQQLAKLRMSKVKCQLGREFRLQAKDSSKVILKQVKRLWAPNKFK